MVQTQTLHYYLQRKNNNFDLLRVLLAFFIIVQHTSPIAQIPAPIFYDNALQLNFGNAAVAFFFFLSGLVVTNSLLTKYSFIHYAVSRSFRILPGLACVLVATAFIIGPLVTTLSLPDYFAEKEVYDYVRVNLTLGARHYLPGVFANNIGNPEVNGSLWTINWEIKSYIYLFVFVYLFSFNKKVLQLGLLIGFILLLLSGVIDVSIFSRKISTKPYFILFFVAAVMCVLKEQIKINRYTFGLTLIFLVGGFFFTQNNALEFPAILLRFSAIALLLMHIAFWPPLTHFRLKHDISFGVYIWAFPIGQTIEYYLPTLNYLTHALVVGLLSFIMGSLSWIYIEKPCIKKGQKIANALSERYTRFRTRKSAY